MGRQLVVVTIGMCLCMLVTTIPGCATNRVSLVDQGIVSIKTVPSERVRILWADVYEDGKDAVVCGNVRRLSYTNYPMKVHVAVTVSSPDGTILQEARTPDIYVPGHRPGKTVDWKHFEVRFPDIPQDSKVSVIVHSSLHEDKT